MSAIPQPTTKPVVSVKVHTVSALRADTQKVEGYTKADFRVSADIIRQHQPPPCLLQLIQSLAMPIFGHW